MSQVKNLPIVYTIKCNIFIPFPSFPYPRIKKQDIKDLAEMNPTPQATKELVLPLLFILPFPLEYYVCSSHYGNQHISYSCSFFIDSLPPSPNHNFSSGQCFDTFKALILHSAYSILGVVPVSDMYQIPKPRGYPRYLNYNIKKKTKKCPVLIRYSANICSVCITVRDIFLTIGSDGYRGFNLSSAQKMKKGFVVICCSRNHR